MSLMILNAVHQIIFNCSCQPVSSRDRIGKIKQNPDEYTTYLCRSSGEMLQTFTTKNKLFSLLTGKTQHSLYTEASLCQLSDEAQL